MGDPYRQRLVVTITWRCRNMLLMLMLIVIVIIFIICRVISYDKGTWAALTCASAPQLYITLSTLLLYLFKVKNHYTSFPVASP